MPGPVVDFTISPSRPHIGDTVQLMDCSHDPGEVGIGWRAWSFGDGTTSVGPAAVHRYGEPGEYDVTLTLATFDGRVACLSQRVSIRRA